LASCVKVGKRRQPRSIANFREQSISNAHGFRPSTLRVINGLRFSLCQKFTAVFSMAIQPCVNRCRLCGCAHKGCVCCTRQRKCNWQVNELRFPAGRPAEICLRPLMVRGDNLAVEAGCPRDLRLDLTPALATPRKRGIVCLQTGSGGRGSRPLPVTLDFPAFSGQFGAPVVAASKSSGFTPPKWLWRRG
jgi:hypothetical protein